MLPHQGHPVSRRPGGPFPLGCATHLLLPTSDHAAGVLKARCGHYVLTVAPLHDDPHSRVVPALSLGIFTAGSDAPGRFAGEVSPAR